MKLFELPPSETHRHFVIPLQLKGRYKQFGMPYSYVKRYFAAFRAPWNGHTAVLEEIGSINGVNQVELQHKLHNEIPSFTAREYGLVLHVI